MGVCKFYMQGNCKYGDRCRYEHPRHSSRGNREWYDDSYEYEERHNNRGRQNYNENYNRGHQSQKYYGTRNYDYDDGSSYSHGKSSYDRGYSRTSKQDRYHWSKKDNSFSSNNRFSALSEEKNSNTDAEVIFTTIKTDVQTWAESKMWPFSCYSHTKEAACIEGLPDISPEEMRVVTLLHPQQYQTIWNEVEANYCKVKDELYAMSNDTKGNLMSQLTETDSNPSRDLKISYLYGPEFNFSQKKSATQQTSIPVSVPTTTLQANSFINSGNTMPSHETGTVSNSTGPQATSTPFKSPPSQNISVFGSTTPRSSVNSGESSDVFTPLSMLSNEEKASFEAEKFTLGKIPTKPPSQQYCV